MSEHLTKVVAVGTAIAIGIGASGCGEPSATDKAARARDYAEEKATSHEDALRRRAEFLKALRIQGRAQKKCEQSPPVRYVSAAKNLVEIDYMPEKKFHKFSDPRYDLGDCVSRNPNETGLTYLEIIRVTCLGTALLTRTTDYARTTEHHVVGNSHTTYVPDQLDESGLVVTASQHNSYHSTEHVVTSHGISSQTHSTTIPNHIWCPDGEVSLREVKAPQTP